MYYMESSVAARPATRVDAAGAVSSSKLRSEFLTKLAWLCVSSLACTFHLSVEKRVER